MMGTITVYLFAKNHSQPSVVEVCNENYKGYIPFIYCIC